jgi:hypothetical protein
MRLLIASMAALAAVAFAAPSYAQTPEDSTTAPAPAPVPTAKPKPGTAAYCQSLKTSSSRSSCLKKVSTAKATKTTTAKKTKKTTTTPATPKPQPDVGQLSAPPAAAPAAAAPSGTVIVPPLPQKTI